MSFKMSDNHDLLNDNDMYSFSGYEVDDMCFNNDIAACRDGSTFVPQVTGQPYRCKSRIWRGQGEDAFGCNCRAGKEIPAKTENYISPKEKVEAIKGALKYFEVI